MNKESRLDIAARLLVIDHFNGKTMLLKQIRISANKLHLCTDAARSLGFGAIFENEWFYPINAPVNNHKDSSAVFAKIEFFT
jgi:hypothetical protein